MVKYRILYKYYKIKVFFFTILLFLLLTLIFWCSVILVFFPKSGNSAISWLNSPSVKCHISNYFYIISMGRCVWVPNNGLNQEFGELTRLYIERQCMYVSVHVDVSLALCPWKSWGSRLVIKKVLSRTTGVLCESSEDDFKPIQAKIVFLSASLKAGKQQCKCQDASALSQEETKQAIH